jgi:hypothetical protein
MVANNISSKIRKYKKSSFKRRSQRKINTNQQRNRNRSSKFTGYWEFTSYVWKVLWSNRNIFILLAAVYASLMVLMTGIASQDTYTKLADKISVNSGNILSVTWGEISKASSLFSTAIGGGFSQTTSDVQQVYAGLILLLAWLTTVWLLRNILAGHKVKLRDGLYSAGSPMFSTAIVAVVFLVQLLPFALALVGIYAASTTGLFNIAIGAIIFWIVAGLLTALSFYWVISTFFALVIVTLPGMYPFRAIRAANNLVVGRRFKILLRLLWLVFVTVLAWALIMIPIIILDSWFKNAWSAISWVPTIPLALLALSSLTTVWVSSYIYLLYRQVVDDESKSA